jgi:hypothetical protein
MGGILQFITASVYSYMLSFVEELEKLEVPKAASLYSQTKETLLGPIQRIWDAGANVVKSNLCFFDSLVLGVIPAVDSSVDYLKFTSLFFIKKALEFCYRADMLCLALLSPILGYMRTFPMAAQFMVTAEYWCRYLLVEWLEADFEDFADELPSPTLFADVKVVPIGDSGGNNKNITFSNGNNTASAKKRNINFTGRKNSKPEHTQLRPESLATD